jgi:Phospholipase_D-nuclease N-terminal
MLALMIVGAVLLGLGALFFLPFAVMLLIFVLAIASFVFWIWMLVDAIQNRGLSEGEKVGWVLAIVFLHFVGGLIYYFIGRPKRDRPLPAT